ncbi:MAG TPA: FtsX-like permease family protein [Candidatus Saccharimonadales bacterium]|nr:FtsX-like permease family protein [Candidatus Saccharimonadales bacterium]
MNTITFGIRNTTRNLIRSTSIVLILGLSIGLSLTMLIAHQAVSNKIKTIEGSIGNTISISPAGFSGFSSVNNALTTSQLSKVKTLPHITSLQESLTDHLTTVGSSQPVTPFGGSSNSTNQTSLKSPIKINFSGNGVSGTTGSGGGFKLFIAGGLGQSGIPANFSPPVSVVGTNDTTDVNGQTLTITSGTAINGSSNTDDAMVSQAMASKNNLKVGSTFTAYSTTLTVAGIFTTSTQAGNNFVVLSLPTEQRLSGQSSDVTSATATVDSLSNLSSATSAISKQLGSSADVVSSQTQANNTLAPLNSVKSVSLSSVIGATIAGAVIILLTMIMIVRERRREIGVLKAIGASSSRVISQFAVEAVTLTLIASVIGMGLGVIAGNPITKTLVNNSTSSAANNVAVTGPGGAVAAGPGPGGGFFRRIGGGGQLFRHNLSSIHAAVGWSIIIYGLGAAILIAIIGSVVASWMITKIRPSEVMRTE